MGLIKASNAPVGVAPFSMRDIESHAKSILLRARQQADELLAAAQSEAEELKRAAHEQGLAEGTAQGMDQGRAEGAKAGQRQALEEHRTQLKAALASLADATAKLDAGRHDLESAATTEVVHLAAAIARRVTKRQSLIDPGVLAANLEEAMKLVVRAADVRIAIHPAQHKTLAEAMPHLQTRWPTLKHVQVVEDAAIEPGGCRVYTDQGQVDATLDVQLDRIVADLLPAATPILSAARHEE